MKEMSKKLKEKILKIVLSVGLFLLLHFVMNRFGLKIDDSVPDRVNFIEKRDSFKTVLDSMKKQLYLDSLLIKGLKQKRDDKIDSISGMSTSELYSIWSDGHYSGTEFGTAGGIPK